MAAEGDQVATTDISVNRTYLYITELPDSSQRLNALPLGIEFKELPAGSLQISFLHHLYSEVGRDLHWEDRLNWSAEQYQELISQPGFGLHVLYVDGEPAGYAELLTSKRFEPDGITMEVDASISEEGTAGYIAYFGLLSRYRGRGLGKLALELAIDAAWKAASSETDGKTCAYIWLHTCWLDLQPTALLNYMKRGFKVLGRDTYVHRCNMGRLECVAQ
eukprot:TRINITY_DN17006_c0_g1_i1.p1 TRINITY_DN17006_c0_g1~~TRINITY_DN17006_c0_g1_i1.p1  ORF type:complete len:219 (+),score=0.86 TRINITY_DN17006_c0_g1_i1:225-881(+)